MPDKPKLSLIICSKDRSEKLKQCLQTISAEEILQVGGELILVNNNSTDDTEEIMRNFQKKAPFPVHVITEPKTGLSHARNAALCKVRGEVIVFTDDDCFLTKEYLIKAGAIFDSGEFDYCSGQILPYGSDARIGVATFNVKYTIEPHTFLDAGWIQGANMIFSKRLIEKTGFFDTTLGAGTAFLSEDLDYAARANSLGFKGARIPDLIIYHHHGRTSWQDIQSTVKGYDYGRGAYYMKCIMRGELISLRWWYRYLRHSKYNVRREACGALLYLVTRLFFFDLNSKSLSRNYENRLSSTGT